MIRIKFRRSNVKALVFDLDGTLVDSTEFWDNIGKNYLISQGVIPKEDLNEAIAHLRIGETAAYMVENYELGKAYMQVKEDLDQILFLFYKKQARLKPFALDMIKLLKDKNVRVAIASVTDDEFIQAFLDKHDMSHYFEFIQTNGNTQLTKHDEDYFKLLTKRLDMEAKDIYLFEDSLYSMKTAKKAGLNVVAVEDDYSKKNIREIIEVADIYIKNFGHIIDLLQL